MDKTIYNGVFQKKKMNLFCWLAIPAVFLAALFLYIGFTDPKADWSAIFVILIFAFFTLALAVFFLLMNHGAFVRIDLSAGTIAAKFNWFAHFVCRMDEVQFVVPQMNGLTLILKNGKWYSIGMLQNSGELSYIIRKSIYRLETESPEKLRENLITAKRAYKKKMIRTFLILPFLFLGIFACVILTGGRELEEFSNGDWLIFAGMIVFGIAVFVGALVSGRGSGELMHRIEWLDYRRKAAVIATQPFPSNIVKLVYTDADSNIRISVCGYPNDDSVYFCIQAIAEDSGMVTVETSDVYPDMDAFLNGPENRDFLAYLIDITSALKAQKKEEESNILVD